jgi:tetrahydromethanopterin:alpha-L-glutamate ligase
MVDVAIFDRGFITVEMQELLDLLADRGITASYVDWDRLSFSAEGPAMLLDGAPFTPAIGLVRSRLFTRVADVAMIFDTLALIESAGTTLINSPVAVQRAHNKVLSVALLGRAGLPVPATRLVRTVEEAADCLRQWRSVVIKPVHGHASVGNALLRDDPRLHSTDTPGGLAHAHEIQLAYLLRVHGAVCAQRYVDGTVHDVRVMVIQDRIVACYRRKALHGPTDPATADNPQAIEVVHCTPEFTATVLGACNTLGLAHASVDFVENDKHERFIVEVNPVISFWRHLCEPRFHLVPGGVPEAMADMLGAALPARAAAVTPAA